MIKTLTSRLWDLPPGLLSVRAAAGLQQHPLPRQVGLLRDGALQAPCVAIGRPALPPAEVSVEDVLNVLHDQVDGH